MEGKALNGYKVRSWGDLIAVATLLAMLISVVLWGLKLEQELNVVRDSANNTAARVADGILPRAEERIKRHSSELQELRRRIERLEDDEHNHKN